MWPNMVLQSNTDGYHRTGFQIDEIQLSCVSINNSLLSEDIRLIQFEILAQINHVLVHTVYVVIILLEL